MLPPDDAEPLSVLATFLARRLGEGSARLRVWSAACGTGEEAWSIAIAVEESPELARADVRILATDPSAAALERAREGVYDAERITPRLRERWFEARPDRRVSARPELRSRVVFRALDLARAPFPIQGPLDAIVCRNALGSLEGGVRQALVTEFHRLLAPGGLLLVGPAESIAGLGPPSGRLRRVAPSIYAK